MALVIMHGVVLVALLSFATGFQWIKPFPSAVVSFQKFNDRTVMHAIKRPTRFRRIPGGGGNYEPVVKEAPKRNWQRPNVGDSDAPPKFMKKIRLPDKLTLPKVKRPVKGIDKVPLESLHVGQRLRGRVINILEYGMFVDVGTSKDGLVHIRDIDNQHFVHAMDSRFRPGDDITVYVKFVVPEEKKFGLQLHPVNELLEVQAAAFRNQSKLKLDDLRPEQELVGQVVRTSNYGVYVDIGVEGILAFLHRRKMKSNRRMRHYTPVEVCPMGSLQTCYVHEIEKGLKRVSVSTYHPDEWALRIVPPRGLRAVKDPEAEIYEYGFDGGEAPSSKDKYKRMLQMERIINGERRARGEQRGDGRDVGEGDDDADFDDEDTNTSSAEVERYGEKLSPEEIRKLSPEYAQLILDDSLTDTSSTDTSSTRAPANTNTNIYATSKDRYSHLYYAKQRTTAEVFDSVRHPLRPFIVFSDLKRWKYIKLMCFVNKLTLPDLQQIFLDAGAVAGRMNVHQFGRFRALLDVFLDLKPDTGDYSDLNIDPDKVQDSDFTHEFDGLDDYNYGDTKNQAEEEVFDLGEYSFPEVYGSGTGSASGSIGGNGSFSADVINSAGSGGAAAGTGRFAKLLTRKASSSAKAKDSASGDVFVAATTTSCEADAATLLSAEPAKRGRKKKVVTVASDATSTGISAGTDSAASSAAAVLPTTTTTTSGAADGFDVSASDTISTTSPKKRGRKLKVTSTLPTEAGIAIDASDVGTVPATVAGAVGGGASTDASDRSGTEDSAALEDADELDVKALTDEELSQQAFRSISNDKPHISLKDLRGWDLVHIMLAEGTLTEASLQEIFDRYKAMCGCRKGIDFSVFDPFVDELAVLFGASRAAQEGLMHGEDASPAPKKKSHPKSLPPVNTDIVRAAVNDAGCRGGGAIEGEDEAVELDSELEFARMSHGKGHITLKALKKWTSSYLTEGLSPLPERAWAEILADCRISNTDAITAPQFEEVVDAVLARYEVASECSEVKDKM